MPIDGALVDAAFGIHRALARAPRMAWGVLLEGALAHAGGHDADEHTAFRIASMTKSFTAAAVLALRDDGVLRLDEPIAAYAPELGALRPPTADSPRPTVRDLLTMTSGLASDDPWADRHLDLADADLDAVVASGAHWAGTPRTMFEYSNLGYAVLGRVVARLTGAPVQELIRTRFLVPLGLAHTSFTADALPPGTSIAAGFAPIEGEYAEELQLDDGTMAPMGGLYSTVTDLAVWSSFMLDAFPPRDDPDAAPLSRASRREMQRVWTGIPHEVRVSGDGRRRAGPSGYGMGISVSHDDALGPVLGHSGGLPGYGSNMRWVPDAGVALIALANVTYAPMADATFAVLDVLAQHGDVHRTATPAPAAIEDAAERLVALLDSWDDARADALFSDNVFLDESRPRRRAAADALRNEHGAGFVIERIDADSGASATVHVRGARTSFIVELQLAPLVPPLVEWYEAHT